MVPYVCVCVYTSAHIGARTCKRILKKCVRKLKKSESVSNVLCKLVFI